VLRRDLCCGAYAVGCGAGSPYAASHALADYSGPPLHEVKSGPANFRFSGLMGRGAHSARAGARAWARLRRSQRRRRGPQKIATARAATSTRRRSPDRSSASTRGRSPPRRCSRAQICRGRSHSARRAERSRARVERFFGDGPAARSVGEPRPSLSVSARKRSGARRAPSILNQLGFRWGVVYCSGVV